MDEPRYTLDEARKIIQREECDETGHDIVHDRMLYVNGKVARDTIYCTRCNSIFQEA